MVPCDAPHLIVHVLQGQFPEASSSHGPEMDASVWRNLPEELLERVLSALPGCSRTRLSAVCKKWRFLFSSSQFRRLRDAVRPLPPTAPPPMCVVEYQPGHLLLRAGHPLPSAVAYIQQARGLQLRKLSLSFLPRHFWLFSPRNLLTKHGLVCIFKSMAGRPSAAVWSLNICVANPLTKTWLQLPPYGQEEADMRRRDWRVEMEVDKSAAIAHFRVMLLIRRLVDGMHRMCVHTFSSKTGTWNSVCLEGRYHGDQMQGTERWPRYGFSETCLYSLSLERGRPDYELLVHEMEAGRILHRRPLPEIRDPFKFMVRSDGVLCAGENERMGLMPSEAETRVGLWQLNVSNFMWDKISDLPWQLERSLLDSPCSGRRKGKERHSNRRLALDSALLVEDTVVLTLEVQKCVDFAVTGLWSNLVTYHLKTGSWELLCHGLPSHNNGCGRTELCPELFLHLNLGLRPEAFYNPYHVFVPCFSDVQ